MKLRRYEGVRTDSSKTKEILSHVKFECFTHDSSLSQVLKRDLFYQPFGLQAEAEKLAREEQERRDHEEYLKLKEAFTVEEEGEEVIVDSSVSASHFQFDLETTFEISSF